MHRCSWVNVDPLYIDYHDHEWGKPVYDDQKLYEMFLLETFQAGLSWITILHKREAFKEAFDQFDVNKIAMYDDCKINELMNNPKIIRNSRKIKAAVKNAQIFIEIQKEYGSFSKYLWAYTNDKIIYEKKEKNVAGDADIYCSCSGYRCRITPAKACPVCRNVYQTVWNNFFEPA